MNKYIRFILDSAYRFKVLDERDFFSRWSDEKYLKAAFKVKFHKRLDLHNPKTFNEKLNWLKLYNQKEFYTTLADKYMVKDYIKQTIGEEYVVPLLGVWDDASKIEWDKLPNEFVLKATHDSSGAYIVKDKSKINKKIIADKFNKLLKRNYFYSAREYPYKHIKPHIIAETLLCDPSQDGPIQDYKFMCFNGVPRLMYCTIKGGDIYENYYDMDFNPVDINHGAKRHYPEFNKPDNFDQMVKLASILSQNIPFVRVDFFNINGHIYFGEFTFYDWAGLKPFANVEMDYRLGEWIKLPEIKIAND